MSALVSGPEPIGISCLTYGPVGSDWALDDCFDELELLLELLEEELLLSSSALSLFMLQSEQSFP